MLDIIDCPTICPINLNLALSSEILTKVYLETQNLKTELDFEFRYKVCTLNYNELYLSKSLRLSFSINTITYYYLSQETLPSVPQNAILNSKGKSRLSNSYALSSTNCPDSSDMMTSALFVTNMVGVGMIGSVDVSPSLCTEDMGKDSASSIGYCENKGYG